MRSPATMRVRREIGRCEVPLLPRHGRAFHVRKANSNRRPQQNIRAPHYSISSPSFDFHFLLSNSLPPRHPPTCAPPPPLDLRPLRIYSPHLENPFRRHEQHTVEDSSALRDVFETAHLADLALSALITTTIAVTSRTSTILDHHTRAPCRPWTAITRPTALLQLPQPSLP